MNEFVRMRACCRTSVVRFASALPRLAAIAVVSSIFLVSAVGAQPIAIEVPHATDAVPIPLTGFSPDDRLDASYSQPQFGTIEEAENGWVYLPGPSFYLSRGDSFTGPLAVASGSENSDFARVVLSLGDSDNSILVQEDLEDGVLQNWQEEDPLGVVSVATSPQEPGTWLKVGREILGDISTGYYSHSFSSILDEGGLIQRGGGNDAQNITVTTLPEPPPPPGCADNPACADVAVPSVAIYGAATSDQQPSILTIRQRPVGLDHAEVQVRIEDSSLCVAEDECATPWIEIPYFEATRLELWITPYEGQYRKIGFRVSDDPNSRVHWLAGLTELTIEDHRFGRMLAEGWVPTYYLDDIALRAHDISSITMDTQVDSFENGWDPMWDLTTSHALTISPLGAIEGSQGLMLPTHTFRKNRTLATLSHTLAQPEKRVSSRFSIDRSNLTLKLGERFSVFGMFKANGNEMLSVDIRRHPNGTYRMLVVVVTGEGGRWTPWKTLSLNQQKIDVTVSYDSERGSVNLWLDGVRVGSLKDLDLSTRPISSVSLGGYDLRNSIASTSSVIVEEAGWMGIDDFILWH